MPINVTCPECLFAFAVADEYAGQQGRCAQCAAIIRVPGGTPAPVNPYGTPHHDDDYGDTLRRARRTTPEPPPMPERSPREPRPARQAPTFDANARAARWLKVANGYRNLMLAAVLNIFGWGLLCAYIMTAGVDKFDQMQIDDGRVAAQTGLYAATAIALAFWTLGRMAGRSTPYVPARMMSMGSSVCAMLGGGASVLGLAGMAIGVLVARNDLNTAVAIMSLSLLGVMFGMMLVVVGEFFGLISQMRIADALQATGFGTMSKLLMAVFMLGTAGTFFCGCLVVMVASQEAQKQQAQKMKKDKKKDEQPNNGGNFNANPPKEEPKAVEKPKDQAKNENPKDDKPKDEDDDEKPPEVDPAQMRTAQQIVVAIMFLGVLFVSGFYFQCARLGRRAILQEVERLVGRDDETNKEHNYEG